MLAKEHLLSYHRWLPWSVHLRTHNQLPNIIILQCVDIYQGYQHSCFLYLGSVVVDEFGAEPSFHQGLMQFLQALVEVALKLLVAPGALVENPDTVDDLFRLCSRYCCFLHNFISLDFFSGICKGAPCSF